LHNYIILVTIRWTIGSLCKPAKNWITSFQ